MLRLQSKGIFFKLLQLDQLSRQNTSGVRSPFATPLLEGGLISGIELSLKFPGSCKPRLAASKLSNDILELFCSGLLEAGFLNEA